MIPDSFKAYYVNGDHRASVRILPTSMLPDHEVTIQVEYSSLNYKDGLSARGRNRVTKSYPHIPGIDAVGTVLDDRSNHFSVGDKVIVTGNDLGTNTFGGFGSIISIPAEWVVPIPVSMTPFESMIMGTAGFTALYGIKRLQVEGVEPGSGPILVTGSTGGVGSFAVFALSKLGYEVHAATRKPDQSDFLTELGASEIIDSGSIVTESDRPLLPRKWAGSIDTVGGIVLNAVLAQTFPKGAVACCGNVLGIELKTNILPFILRGISLLGIDSAFCIRTLRTEIWKQASELNFSDLPEEYARLVCLEELDPEIDKILSGQQKGRVVIQH